MWLKGNDGKWSTPAIVKLRREHNRSYIVETEGGMYLRNQKFLKPRNVSPDSTGSPVVGPDSAEQAALAAGPAGPPPVTGGPAFRTRSRAQARSA